MNDEQLKKQKGGLRLWNAWKYSLDGFKTAWKTEQAFRQESYVAAILLPVAVIMPVSIFEKLLMMASLLGILVVELLNSAIESTIDLAVQKQHPLAKNAKDMGSAAVLLSIFIAVTIWICVLFSIATSKDLFN